MFDTVTDLMFGKWAKFLAAFYVTLALGVIIPGHALLHGTHAEADVQADHSAVDHHHGDSDHPEKSGHSHHDPNHCAICLHASQLAKPTTRPSVLPAPTPTRIQPKTDPKTLVLDSSDTPVIHDRAPPTA